MSTKNEVVYDIDGLNRDEAIFKIASENGGDIKAAKLYYKDNKGAPAPSFKATFYAALADAPMTEEEFDAIIATGSDNVVSHKSAHKMVWEMAQKVWAAV